MKKITILMFLIFMTTFSLSCEVQGKQIIFHSNSSTEPQDVLEDSGDEIICFGMADPELPDPPGGGDPPNNSFATAENISVGTQKYVLLSVGEEEYFKTSRNTLDYLSFYTTGTSDVRVYLYNSSFQQIGYNDNATGHGLALTSGDNCAINFYCDVNTMYYFKVKLTDSSICDSTYIHLVKDNWYTNSNIENLIIDLDAANNGIINYYSTSTYQSYISTSVAEWNKLGTIEFVRVFNQNSADLVITDVTYPGNNVPGECIFYSGETIIQLNTSYMSYYSDSYKKNTILHELGHSLGLDEFYGEDLNNVMIQNINGQDRLGPADIAAYAAKWE